MVGWQDIRSSRIGASPWLACCVDPPIAGGLRQWTHLERSATAEGVRLVLCEGGEWATFQGPPPLGLLLDCAHSRPEDCARELVSRLGPEGASSAIDMGCGGRPSGEETARDLLHDLSATVSTVAVIDSDQVDRVASLMRVGVSEVFARPVCPLRFRRWLRERIAAQRAAGVDLAVPRSTQFGVR